jgi:hypothetical protein
MSIPLTTETSSSSGKIIPAQFVRMHEAKAKTAAPRLVPQDCAVKLNEPKIVLHKDGETVRAIEIVCTCGAVIRLDCEYEQP